MAVKKNYCSKKITVLPSLQTERAAVKLLCRFSVPEWFNRLSDSEAVLKKWEDSFYYCSVNLQVHFLLKDHIKVNKSSLFTEIWSTVNIYLSIFSCSEAFLGLGGPCLFKIFFFSIKII